MDFIEGLITDMMMNAAIKAGKGPNGKANPYVAAGIVSAVNGKLPSEDIARMNDLLRHDENKGRRDG